MECPDTAYYIRYYKLKRKTLDNSTEGFDMLLICQIISGTHWAITSKKILLHHHQVSEIDTVIIIAVGIAWVGITISS